MNASKFGGFVRLKKLKCHIILETIIGYIGAGAIMRRLIYWSGWEKIPRKNWKRKSTFPISFMPSIKLPDEALNLSMRKLSGSILRIGRWLRYQEQVKYLSLAAGEVVGLVKGDCGFIPCIGIRIAAISIWEKLQINGCRKTIRSKWVNPTLLWPSSLGINNSFLSTSLQMVGF